MIINVESKQPELLNNKLRDELLSWVNNTLKSKFTKIEELCTGAAYCQLIHSIFPHAIAIRSVKFVTNLEHECNENLKILQRAFQRLGITRPVPVSRLCKGKFRENFEFLVWFRKFYDANVTRMNYDPVAVRNGMPMKYGPIEIRRIYEQRAKDALKDKVLLYRMKAGLSDRENECEDKQQVSKIAIPRSTKKILQRSATRTLIKYKSNKFRKHSLSADNSIRDLAMTYNNEMNEPLNASKDRLDIPVRLKRSDTRTIIRCKKAFDQEVNSLNAVCKKLSMRKLKSSDDSYNNSETELYALRNQLREFERIIDQKNRESCEKDLELIKLQNEINEMRTELRESKRDRDSYFDKMNRVAICCRDAQYKAEVSVPISAVLKIFLDEMVGKGYKMV